LKCSSKTDNLVVNYEDILKCPIFDRYQNRILKSKEFSIQFVFDANGKVVSMGPYKP